jgi:hypothetical protein
MAVCGAENCAESLRWISAPGTPSDHNKRITDHNKRITERCSSLVQTENGAAMVNVTVKTNELT